MSCLIVGTSDSLNKVKVFPKLLEENNTIFFCNHWYYGIDKFYSKKFLETKNIYITMMDPVTYNLQKKWIEQYENFKFICFIGDEKRHTRNAEFFYKKYKDRSVLIHKNDIIKKFNKNIFEFNGNVSSTGLASIICAMYLGYDNINVIGHDYLPVPYFYNDKLDKKKNKKREFMTVSYKRENIEDTIKLMKELTKNINFNVYSAYNNTYWSKYNYNVNLTL